MSKLCYPIKKILVVSDTHGDFASLKKVYNLCRPDLLIHLGDGVWEAMRLAQRYFIPLEAVNGNGDPPGAYPDESILEIGKHRLMLCHGHQYYNQSFYEATRKHARKEKATWILSGHTHCPDFRQVRGKNWLNPGALCFHLTGGNPSFALLDVEKNELIVQFKCLRELHKTEINANGAIPLQEL
jgi:putative phosphoesterase